jgi:hypothetical protein
MNAALVTPATIRGRAALDEVRALFDQLYLIDSDIADLAEKGKVTDWPYGLSQAEMDSILDDRRTAVLNKLENKGIRIAPDPVALAPVDAEAA